MKHAKFQMPRLSCVSWLLAASLVLGWAGEAPAQNLLGSFDPGFVHEAGGAQDITVTLETEGGVAAKADITIQVLFDYAGQTARYRDDLFTLSTMPTLTIKQGAKKVTGTFTITPIANDRAVVRFETSGCVCTLTVGLGSSTRRYRRRSAAAGRSEAVGDRKTDMAQMIVAGEVL